jgi:hypothetical protein
VRPGDSLTIRARSCRPGCRPTSLTAAFSGPKVEVTNQDGAMVIAFVTVTQMPAREKHLAG